MAKHFVRYFSVFTLTYGYTLWLILQLNYTLYMIHNQKAIKSKQLYRINPLVAGMISVTGADAEQKAGWRLDSHSGNGYPEHGPIDNRSEEVPVMWPAHNLPPSPKSFFLTCRDAFFIPVLSLCLWGLDASACLSVSVHLSGTFKQRCCFSIVTSLSPSSSVSSHPFFDLLVIKSSEKQHLAFKRSHLSI